MVDFTSDPQPLTVGSFEGSVVESSSATTGALSDGTTRVQFETDLSTEDVATLLASLRPFDAETEPDPLASSSF